MTDMEKKKKRVALLKLDASIAELELKICEREEDIERIKQHIEQHKLNKQEIQKELKED